MEIVKFYLVLILTTGSPQAEVDWWQQLGYRTATELPGGQGSLLVKAGRLPVFITGNEQLQPGVALVREREGDLEEVMRQRKVQYKWLEENVLEFVVPMPGEYAMYFSSDSTLFATLGNHVSPVAENEQLVEIALGVPNAAEAVEAWAALDFESTTEHLAPNIPEPYAILGLDFIPGVGIGVHQTQDFEGPMLTYFAVDMAQRIAHLTQSTGVEPDSYVPGVGGEKANAIFTSPSGYGLFLFTISEEEHRKALQQMTD